MKIATPDRDALNARIQRCMDDLPPLSPTVTKVLLYANASSARADELVRLIKLDPVLTARVLKLINSPFYGMNNVTSVARALVMLGFNTVKNLVLSSALVGFFAEDERSGRELSVHSIYVAVAARALARRARLPREIQEASFTGGLTHDLGHIVVSRFFPKELEDCRMQEAQGIPQLEAEMRIFGMTHEFIGGQLGRRWQLPSIILAAVESHHMPRLIGEGAEVSCLTHIANVMYYSSGLGIRCGASIPELSGEALELLGLTDSDVDAALLGIPDEVEMARVFLEHSG